MRFDLTEQPWIPVRGPDGAERELGLRELFREAPALTDLSIAFAPERVAVTRILVAVLQAATRGPFDRVERIAWLDGPAPIIERVEAYLEEWRPRFDLFDAERPFMQLPVGEGVKDTAIAALRLDWASGNNATLFDHHHDGDLAALTPGEATRALLTTLLHQPGGGVSKPFNRTDSPGSKPLLVLPLGRDLWETLVLSSPADETLAHDHPIWELDDEGREPVSSGTTPRGWLDRLTWRSRAIRLLPDDNGLVRRCRVRQHLKLADGSLGDRHAAVIRSTEDGDRIVRLSSSKRLWRQADAVLRGVGGVSPRSAVEQAVRTAEERDGFHPQIFISGLQIDQAKVGDAQSAILPVSAALLEDEDRIAQVGDAIELAEQASRALGAACGAFHAVLKIETNPAARASWQQPFWARAAREFGPFLRALATADASPNSGDPAWTAWADAVGRHAQRALEQQLTASPFGGAHEAGASAMREFHRRCRMSGIPLSRGTRLSDGESAEPEITTTTTEAS